MGGSGGVSWGWNRALGEGMKDWFRDYENSKCINENNTCARCIFIFDLFFAYSINQSSTSSTLCLRRASRWGWKRNNRALVLALMLFRLQVYRPGGG